MFSNATFPLYYFIINIRCFLTSSICVSSVLRTIRPGFSDCNLDVLRSKHYPCITDYPENVSNRRVMIIIHCRHFLVKIIYRRVLFGLSTACNLYPLLMYFETGRFYFVCSWCDSTVLQFLSKRQQIKRIISKELTKLFLQIISFILLS